MDNLASLLAELKEGTADVSAKVDQLMADLDAHDSLPTDLRRRAEQQQQILRVGLSNNLDTLQRAADAIRQTSPGQHAERAELYGICEAAGHFGRRMARLAGALDRRLSSG